MAYLVGIETFEKYKIVQKLKVVNKDISCITKELKNELFMHLGVHPSNILFVKYYNNFDVANDFAEQCTVHDFITI